MGNNIKWGGRGTSDHGWNNSGKQENNNGKHNKACTWVIHIWKNILDKAGPNRPYLKSNANFTFTLSQF